MTSACASLWAQEEAEWNSAISLLNILSLLSVTVSLDRHVTAVGFVRALRFHARGFSCFDVSAHTQAPVVCEENSGADKTTCFRCKGINYDWALEPQALQTGHNTVWMSWSRLNKRTGRRPYLKLRWARLASHPAPLLDWWTARWGRSRFLA